MGRVGDWLRRKVRDPLVAELRQGVTPEALATAVATGGALGLLPFLGTTTAACALAGRLARLNHLALQLTNYLLAPVQLLLIIPFVRLGEWLTGAAADLQLARFKQDPARRGQVCAQGLWGWTRHPNYFGEWLIWVGFALLSWTPLLQGIPGLLCAGGMYYLLNHVTGIPLTEQQLLTSKGAAYAEYQTRVPAFWPRPPRA